MAGRGDITQAAFAAVTRIVELDGVSVEAFPGQTVRAIPGMFGPAVIRGLDPRGVETVVRETATHPMVVFAHAPLEAVRDSLECGAPWFARTWVARESREKPWSSGERALVRLDGAWENAVLPALRNGESPVLAATDWAYGKLHGDHWSWCFANPISETSGGRFTFFSGTCDGKAVSFSANCRTCALNATEFYRPPMEHLYLLRRETGVAGGEKHDWSLVEGLPAPLPPGRQ